MGMNHISDKTFDGSIREEGVTLVDFGAPWCPPCKALVPILDQLDRDNGERISILEVNCDESPALAGKYGVMSLPTIILFHNGVPVEKIVGLRPLNVYQSLVARYVQ
ncbi:thioredoxin family protein [Paenibacillus sp. sptzw28]|uniref:thioredoxin family protein n=1 Tax=Paenibacillus sp. sptzw28 TaxID=715179 RepID=UPI001C6F53E2|nr:thioredoxin family protein [Paenibacillus sp. sptzw28]QYR22040.1 thioredoxin family protein [Paenibacillus sp. sptzw28]